MFLVAIAAATLLSAPVPANLKNWATVDDVPVNFLPEDTEFLVGFRVIVDPTGKPQSCRIELSSRLKDLDKYTCSLVISRAHFAPARNASGDPSYGVYVSNLDWWVGSTPKPPPHSFAGDLDLTVSSLPAGTKSPQILRVMFVVDAQGRASSCAAEKPEDAIPAQLVQLACDQVLQQFKPVPVKDSSGQLVSSVQDAEVRFSIK